MITEVRFRGLTPEQAADRGWQWSGELRRIGPRKESFLFYFMMNWFDEAG